MQLRSCARSRWSRRFAPRLALALAALTALVLAGAVANAPHADLRVLCSNNDASCVAVTRAYAERTGTATEVVRVPTSQALDRLTDPERSAEFDVWMGGPADAYALAEARGLLAHLPDGSVWAPVYGGVLGLCMREELTISTWAELVAGEVRVAVPHPLTSGTASTLLALQRSLHGEGDVAYLRRLDAVTAAYTDSGVAPAALVAAGRVDVGVTFAPYCRRHIDRGAPLRMVFPAEGTSYEVGAIAVLADAADEARARDFVEFASSPAGQAISAEVAAQAPIASSLPGDLGSQLEAMTVPVVHLDPVDVAGTRQDLLRAWVEEVRHGRP